MSELNHDLETTTAIAKKVLPEMAKWKIPLIPENYHVWFEYTIGNNDRLRTDLDAIMASGKPFAPDVNEDLYRRYFGDKRYDSLMREVRKETQKTLKNILSDIFAANRSTSDFGEKLERYANKLNEADGLSQIQNVIKDVIAETSKMADSSRMLQKRLQKASSDAEALRKQLEETEREARIDALTGLHNRKAFEQKMKELYETHEKDGATFSVIMLDIDHFKTFNDKYGHKIGDEALEIVGAMLRETLKGMDFPARYGGEEFVVLLPKTALGDACTVAEQIRKKIAEKNLKFIKTGERLENITVSLGVAEINRNDTPDTVVERADKALYLAKRTGRNKVQSQKDL